MAIKFAHLPHFSHAKSRLLIPVIPAICCFVVEAPSMLLDKVQFAHKKRFGALDLRYCLGIVWLPDGGPGPFAKELKVSTIGCNWKGHSSASAPHHCCQFRSGKAK